MDKVDIRGYREIPLAWRAVNLPPNLDEVVFRLVLFLMIIIIIVSFLKS